MKNDSLNMDYVHHEPPAGLGDHDLHHDIVKKPKHTTVGDHIPEDMELHEGEPTIITMDNCPSLS